VSGGTWTSRSLEVHGWEDGDVGLRRHSCRDGVQLACVTSLLSRSGKDAMA